MIVPTCPVAANLKTEVLWPQRLRKSICQENWALIRRTQAQTKKKPLPSAMKLFKAFSSKKMTEKHLYKDKEHPQGPFSDFKLVSNNIHIPNELVNTFPYLRHLSQTNPTLYEEELVSITSKVTSKKCLKEWRQVCKKYSPKLDLVQLVRGFFRLLDEGTGFVVEMAKQLECKPKVLLFYLMSMQKYLCFRQVVSPFALSLQKGELVTLESVSKTIKMLFCPICNLFDCSKHMVTELAQRHNFTYLPAHDPVRSIETKKKNIIKIYQHYVEIYYPSPAKLDQSTFCTDQCFRSMTRLDWQHYVRHQRNSSYSRMFQVLLKMGIEMFDYDCCQIATLVYPRTCREVFYYLINCCNLINRLQHKFYGSEKHYLRQEHAEDVVSVRRAKSKKKKVTNIVGKSSVKKNVVRTKEDASGVSNAVCFHYFCEGISEDTDCSLCSCRQRGYCLPQCQCSQDCSIPLKGCRCRNRCYPTTCPCRKANRACLPDLCENCFNSSVKDFSDKTCNNNELTFLKSKLLRIGKSTIPQAGLGLFAGEFIAKDSFVVKYLGQIIEHDVLEKFRENMYSETMFYNFQLSEGKSIDSRHYGNKARFINHSDKDQNVVPARVRINEEDVMIFRALRDIARDEELLFNYNGSGGLSQFRDRYPFISK